jgi:hypothetical protein
MNRIATMNLGKPICNGLGSAGVPPGTSSRIQFKLETPCRALRAFGGTPNAAGVTPALPMRFNNQSK